MSASATNRTPGGHRREAGEPDRVDEAVLSEAAAVLERSAGLRLDPAVRGRLARSVQDAARGRGAKPAAFVSSLGTDPAALQALLDRITVQESSFFRDPAQFEALADLVIPELPDPITAWSAGCANGQEPYSLAMSLAESGRQGWRVIATDVSTAALGRTGEGRYSERELRGLSPARRERFLTREGPAWQVRPELREGVTVTRQNLVADPPPFEPGGCSVVFCRNVIIYFGPERAAAVMDRLFEWLPGNARLFLGFSETLWNISDRFQPERLAGSFVYRPASRSPVSGAPRRLVHRRRSPAPVAPPPVPRPGTRRPPAVTAPPATMPSSGEAMARGQRALTTSDRPGAIAAFRQAAYLDPEDPIAHLQLGLALEAELEYQAALRAFAAARAALDQFGPDGLANALEGFDASELARLIDAKLGALR